MGGSQTPFYWITHKETGEPVALAVPDSDPMGKSVVIVSEVVADPLTYKHIGKFEDHAGVIKASLAMFAPHEGTAIPPGSWLFPITEEMRKSVLEVGQPMYFEEIEDDGIGMTEERLRQYRELQLMPLL